MKTAIIYYSFGGNTKKIADIIKEKTNGDLFEIETEKPYTGSYNSIVDQGQKEVNNGYCPKIKPLSIDLSEYDNIVLGTPVWWYTFAPAMHTFLNENNFNGKTIYPFATNGGWIGHTLEDFESACKGATVKKGLNVKFSGKRQVTPAAQINNWIENIK